MALIHLPQSKWASGTGRQVILKSDFDKIERALLEGFELTGGPALEYVDQGTLRVNATSDCQARVLLCGFPSPLHRGQWVDAGLSDGRYRENAAPATLDFGVAENLWGTEKSNQWYCIYALAGSSDAIFSLKAMPVMRVASQAGQVLSLRNNANSGNIGYGFDTDELAGGQILVLTGASRGLARSITANNADNGTGGTVTYGGASLTLAQGDWFVVLPDTNFRYLGMVLNGGDGNLAPFYQEGGIMGGTTLYRTPRQLSSGALNGFTLLDLWEVAPPTARYLSGYALAAEGCDLKLAVSHDGSTPALLLHATPPALLFLGVRGAMPFECRTGDGHRLYLNNDNTANQTVKITGWRE
jgi:hypothetical protein